MLLPEVFFEIHRGLRRQGPGSPACTRRAFAALGGIAADAAIVDVGCGPGQQTIELARLTRRRILAIDLCEPFLRDLERAARAEGVADLIETRAGDMTQLDLTPASVDLLWSEGAIYIVGFEEGLRLWRPFLKPHGAIAVTEATWLRQDPAEELRAFWADAYPAMGTVEENIARARRAGYEVVDHFTLPDEAWWTDYYTPISARLPEFRLRYANDPEALAIIESEEVEIDLFRRYSAWYGYVFYIMRRSD